MDQLQLPEHFLKVPGNIDVGLSDWKSTETTAKRPTGPTIQMPGNPNGPPKGRSLRARFEACALQYAVAM